MGGLRCPKRGSCAPSTKAAHFGPCKSSNCRLPNCCLRAGPEVRNTSRAGSWVVKPSTFASVASRLTTCSPLVDLMVSMMDSVDGGVYAKSSVDRTCVGASPNVQAVPLAGQPGERLIHRPTAGQVQKLLGQEHVSLSQGFGDRNAAARALEIMCIIS